MNPHVTPHLQVLQDLRRQILELVSALDDDAINREVPPLANTIGILLRHMAGSERYWIGEVVGGRPAHRDRDAEFGREWLRKAALLEELGKVDAVSREVLEGLAPDALLTEVEVRRSSGTVRQTRAFALIHALQHLAYHLGQLRMLARLAQSR
jgi:uncharacterized damage-inducible protein DinB